VRFLSSIVLLTLGACAQPGTVAQTVDIEAEKASLLEVDREFNDATAAEGLDGWVRFFAEDGTMFPQGSPPVRGHEAIRALMSPAFDLEGFSLTWEPVEAEVSEDGSLGYTHGTFEMFVPGEDGEVTSTTGKYLTVWRKQSDGSWKVAADIGNNDPPAAEDGGNE